MPNRKHTLTKIQLAGVRETFGSPKILRNLDELKTHHKTYEALSALCNKIQVAVHNNNMELANKLVEETFVKLKKIRLKTPISANELKSYLNNKSKILEFTKKINSLAGKIAEIMKYEGLINKTFSLVKDLDELYKAKKKKTFIGKGNKGIDSLNDALNGKIQNKYGSYTPASYSKMSKKQRDDF